MHLKNAIDSFEELKKYKFTIVTKKYNGLVLIFQNQHFQHLFGIHYFKLLIPDDVKTAKSIYRYLKKNYSKFEKQIDLQIKNNVELENRVKEFHQISTLLTSSNLKLYKIDKTTPNSQMNCNYVLYNHLLNYHLLLCFHSDLDSTRLHPKSWIVSVRKNMPNLISGKRAQMVISVDKELIVNTN